MGIVSSAMLILSGMYLALGLMYLRFWWDERSRQAYLAFALGCSLYATFAWLELGMFKAVTPGEFLFNAWWGFIPGGLGMVAIAWVAYLQLNGRKWLFVTYAAMRILSLILHLIMANGINFRQVTGLVNKSVLGETLTYPIAVPNPWMVLPHLSHVLVIIFFLDASVRSWRLGERRRALTFGTGTILFATLVLSFSLGFLWGLATIPIMASVAVLFIIAPMLYELNYDMHKAAMLADTLEERDAELIETLEHLQLSASAGSVGMWTRKAGEEIIWISDKAAEIWGLPAGKSVTREELFQHIHPVDRELFVTNSREMDEGRTNEFQLEYRIHPQDGNIRWIQSSGKVESVDGTRIIRGAIVDVTRLKLTESQLTETLEKLQLAASAANVGLWTRKIGGELIWASEEAAEMWGFEPGEQFTQSDIIEHVHPGDRSRFSILFQELGAGKNDYLLECRFLLKDGSIRWIQSKGKVEKVDGTRIIRGAIVDITQLKLIELQLSDTLEKLQLAASAANVGLWSRKIGGDLIWASEEAVEIWGFAPGQKFTKPDIIQQLHPDDRANLSTLFQEMEAGRTHYQIEYRVVSKDGDIRWVNSRGKVEEVDGVPILRGALVDITKQKMAENAIRELSHKLIGAQETERARVARELHDGLNQNIALLALQMAMLRNQPKDLAFVSDQLGKFVTDVELLSRDVHRISYELHPAKLTQLGLEAAIRGFCREFSAKQGLEVDFLADDLPQEISKEISLCLYRITQETFQNIVKHSEATMVSVSVTAEDGDVVLAIIDNGRGFDTDAAKAKGGLGLISMDERARYVNGRATISSTPGGGAKVEVRIPMDQ